MVISPDGAYIYGLSVEHGIQVIQTNPAKLLGTILSPGPHFDQGITLSPDGSLLYMAGPDTQGNEQIWIYSTATNSLVGQIGASGVAPFLYDFFRLVTSPDGAFIYGINTPDYTLAKSDILVASTATRMIRYFQFPLAPDSLGLDGLAITPDGSLLW